MRKEFTNCLLTGVMMEVNIVIQKRMLHAPFFRENDELKGGVI